MSRGNQKGFTMVELLMSMAFFSFILLFVIAGFIQINRSYTKGVTVRRVQDGARATIEDIARTMRGATAVDGILNGPTYRFCVGGIRYGWNQYNGSSHTTETVGGEQINLIKAYDGAACNAPFNVTDDITSPLDEKVKIQYLRITRIGPATSKSYHIKIVVSSKDDSDLQTLGENASCYVQIGDQFCDVAELETVVTLRN